MSLNSSNVEKKSSCESLFHLVFGLQLMSAEFTWLLPVVNLTASESSRCLVFVSSRCTFTPFLNFLNFWRIHYSFMTERGKPYHDVVIVLLSFSASVTLSYPVRSVNRDIWYFSTSHSNIFLTVHKTIALLSFSATVSRSVRSHTCKPCCSLLSTSLCRFKFACFSSITCLWDIFLLDSRVTYHERVTYHINS